MAGYRRSRRSRLSYAPCYGVLVDEQRLLSIGQKRGWQEKAVKLEADIVTFTLAGRKGVPSDASADHNAAKSRLYKRL